MHDHWRTWGACWYHHAPRASSWFLRHCSREGCCWTHFCYPACLHVYHRQGNETLRIPSQGKRNQVDYLRRTWQTYCPKELNGIVVKHRFFYHVVHMKFLCNMPDC